ncbi:uncharacterized protein LOC122380372 [Amphibalanus amphitrite]|uniref:uncharacterized protein LOC122380372 n=1 Tax=Amphibalanus amphitrite TaxID=1232801 RepID=UPI001C90F323|nr:uncharacterized protein LOC122380372 [Amphibalanus amphitrite]
MKCQLLLLVVCVSVVSAGIPKRLFKKYAMQKVMESCFGEQVLSELKEEVAEACERCLGRQGPVLPLIRQRLQAMLVGAELRPRPARFAPSVQFMAVPIQFQQAHRMKRDSHHGMIGPAKIMKLRNKISAMVGNVTCVMQEMNMLTADNEVDIDSIKARISALPLPEGLVADLEQGVDECHQFSSCLPETFFDKTPIAAGFGKQIAFFKCMKMNKVESCMKQDFRENFMPEMLKDSMEMGAEESFQTIITSAILEDSE